MPRYVPMNTKFNPKFDDKDVSIIFHVNFSNIRRVHSGEADIRYYDNPSNENPSNENSSNENSSKIDIENIHRTKIHRKSIHRNECISKLSFIEPKIHHKRVRSIEKCINSPDRTLKWQKNSIANAIKTGFLAIFLFSTIFLHFM
jgi:hypothetical protein